MESSEESVKKLKAQVDELTLKLQGLAEEKGQKLSDKADGVLDMIKKELAKHASGSDQSPFKTAAAALALGLIQEFEPRAKESLKNAAEKSAGLAGGINDGFNEGLDKAVNASKKAEESIAGYVKENPWKALAFAAVLGILIGRAAPRDLEKK